MVTVNGSTQNPGCYVDGSRHIDDLNAATARVAADLIGDNSFAFAAGALLDTINAGDPSETVGVAEALSELADKAVDALNEVTLGGYFTFDDGLVLYTNDEDL